MAQSSKPNRSDPQSPRFHEEFEAVGLDPQDLRHRDNLSFYRALSRHTIGDPAHYESILHAVLTHYWRVLVEKNNPYHGQYKDFEQEIFVKNFEHPTRFVNALSCPDFWLCVKGWQGKGSQALLQVVTDALNIKIVLRMGGKGDVPYYCGGPVHFPEYHVKFPYDITYKYTRCCSALTPCNDGRVLIQYLEDERVRLNGERGFKIKRLVWWRDPVDDGASSDFDSGSDSGSESDPDLEVEKFPAPNEKKAAPRGFKCYNEYSAENEEPPDLVDNPDSFHVFTAAIRYASDIMPALTLLDDALKRAPGQEVPVSQGSGQSRPLKRYVALDAEFKKVYLDEEKLADIEKIPEKDKKKHMMASNPEDLCSVLTVAVDRHLVFSFYLLDMLQNPTRNTVNQVSYLFEKLIFNEEYLKLWFNFQSDINVLDATIAHMYQSTPRQSFRQYVWKTKKKHWVQPTWKIHSKRYNRVRPKQLCFPRFRIHVDSCDLHNNKPQRTRPTYQPNSEAEKTPDARKLSETEKPSEVEESPNEWESLVVDNMLQATTSPNGREGTEPEKTEQTMEVEETEGTSAAENTDEDTAQEPAQKSPQWSPVLDWAPRSETEPEPEPEPEPETEPEETKRRGKKSKPGKGGRRLNARGLSCPCRSTGNVDITTIFDFLCLQLRYKSRSGREAQKRLWYEVGEGCNYGAFLHSTMQTDRLYDMFDYFKCAPDRAWTAYLDRLPQTSLQMSYIEFKSSWYQSLGPGMEADSDKMGYNIGDVAGVALLMRFLTTTDDRMLFITALFNYMSRGNNEVEVKQYPQKMAEVVFPPPISPSASVFLNDYPKSWKRSMIGNDPYPVVVGGRVKVSDIFRGRADDNRRLLSYFEHDTRARAARECFQHAKILYGGAGPAHPEVTESALDAVRARIFDPLKYSFPRWFTREAANPIRPVNGRLPIIRAGVTSYEDLLTLIQDVKKNDPNAEMQLPTIRDHGKSDWYGLPRHLGQAPAEDNSFELPETRDPLSPVEPPRLDRMTRQAKSRLSAAERKGREDIRGLYQDWRLQRRLNKAHGRAAQTRFDDIFDPRGRTYRRHWQETINGQVWKSPVPAGSAMDSEPSTTGDYSASSDSTDSDVQRSKWAILNSHGEQERPTKRPRW